MSTAIAPESDAQKTSRLTSHWQQPGSGPLRLEKSTISNLLRYQPRGATARRLSLGEFNHVLGLDTAAQLVEIEGLTTYEAVVRYCLAHGFLPLVAPELKHITVGIGTESTYFPTASSTTGHAKPTCCCRAAESSRHAPIAFQGSRLLPRTCAPRGTYPFTGSPEPSSGGCVLQHAMQSEASQPRSTARRRSTIPK